MGGSASLGNGLVHGLADRLGLFRDPLLSHETPKIAFEFLSDIEIKLPHTDYYTAQGYIWRLGSSSDPNRNPMIREHRFDIFLHQARGVVIHCNLVERGSHLDPSHAVGCMHLGDVFNIVVAQGPGETVM